MCPALRQSSFESFGLLFCRVSYNKETQPRTPAVLLYQTKRVSFLLLFKDPSIPKPEARFELATCCLRNSYSATELLRRLPKLASLALLLKTRPFLPRPLFNPAYVGVNASQFGQSKRRLLSVLFRQLPSI